jgi:hypothetical protein
MITSPIHDENEPQLVDSSSEFRSTAVEIAKEESDSELDPQTQQVTDPFVGQWNTLISQTNWEKGKIISAWRSALIESGSHVSAFSDETWSRQVGAVTSQHVGRLRRVYDRFSSTQTSYTGLYWSHFLAAVDWDDAELWLEGAARSDWSVSAMRKTRWESSGSDPKHAPRDEELITSEVDDDFDSLTAEAEMESDRSKDDRISASGPLAEGPDFGDEDALDSKSGATSGMQTEDAPWDDAGASDVSNPFASLPDLPPDIADALEQFKLCIVRHRSTHWADVSQKSMLDVLESLRQFTIR